jgi:hypothetical protein
MRGVEGVTTMNEDTMPMVLRRKQSARRQAAEDQVRIAYGAVPVILEGLPPDHPVRTTIRDRARVLLVELGYLTEEELRTLPVKDAIVAALRQFRDEIARTDRVRGGAPRSGRRSASVVPRAAAVPLIDTRTPV